ncbi:LysR family transcriptional regulator [Alphaproteobacteria bacterium]|nr:LysR family transcriptional regulator [Alphaproteobacteria bacterium]
MNTISLETFIAIVETGNLVRASERLHVTQSTVTTRLNALEQDLGQTLIHRQKSGAVMTLAGLQFKRYAEAMLDLWQKARSETALPGSVNQVCNIGCLPDIWPYWGHRLFDHIRTTQPQTALAAWSGQIRDMNEWLDNGVIDMALSYQPIHHESFTSRQIATTKLALFSTRKDGPIRFDSNYLYVDGGENFARQHTLAYSDAGTARISIGSAVWACDYLLENDGSAYLPVELAQPHCDAKRLFKLEDAPVFDRHIYLISNDRVVKTWPWFDELRQNIFVNHE